MVRTGRRRTPRSAGAGAKVVVIEVDGGRAPAEAAFAAAYHLMDRAFMHLERAATGALEVTLRPRPGVTPKELEAAFRAELEEQQVRLALAVQQAAVREEVIGRALFAEPGADPALEALDAIATPWEERYGGADRPPKPDEPAGGTDGGSA
jgi:hypothetical protein